MSGKETLHTRLDRIEERIGNHVREFVKLQTSFEQFVKELDEIKKALQELVEISKKQVELQAEQRAISAEIKNLSRRVEKIEIRTERIEMSSSSRSWEVAKIAITAFISSILTIIGYTLKK